MCKISIIVPTYNPGITTVRVLQERLNAQSIAFDELIVIDSSSSDNSTSAWSDSRVKLSIIPKDDFDHGGTRNYAASLASGDVLLFMTQDAVPANRFWLENLVKVFDSKNVAAAYSRQLPRPDAHPLEAFARCFNYPAESQSKSLDDLNRLGIKTFFFSNVSSAVRSEAFNAVGAFPEKSIMNEDMVLASRLLMSGNRVVYAADSKVWHSHSYTVGQQFKRYFDIGVSLVQNSELQNNRQASGEGFRFVKEQLIFIVQQGRWWLIPRALLESAAKFVAFQIGLWERSLPKRLKRKLSMHSYYWE